MIARTFLALALMGLTAGCATAQKGLPIVRVDAEHIMARRSGGAEAPAYVIRSREGFILDARTQVPVADGPRAQRPR